MHERQWRRDDRSQEQRRNEAIDRRALEIMERRRCNWVEAWARALAEQRLIDGQGNAGSGEGTPSRRRIRHPGRMTLSEQIGHAMPPRPGIVAPGRTTRSAALPAAVMRSAERAEIDPAAAELVTRARHGGAPLEDALRSQLEAMLGTRLDSVRIHTGADADIAARALGARAFAVGDDVFFRDGAYAPQARDGQRLIAHEVAHTVQARGASAPTDGATTVSQPGDAPERQADEFADEFVQRLHIIGVATVDGAVGPVNRVDPRRLERVQRGSGMGTSATSDGQTLLAHEVAAGGTQGSGSPLPFLTDIQRAFGHHDLTAVRAHIGGQAETAAKALGALAYASGDAIAFATAPDLHTAAHEATHVVQQRGGVHLPGGVGCAGDEYEQHADAVADKVAAGESAEPLLDMLAHRGTSGGSSIQKQEHPRPHPSPARPGTPVAPAIVDPNQLLLLPGVMIANGWPQGAALMRQWFASPATVTPAFAPPNTSTITMAWVRTFPRADAVYRAILTDRAYMNAAAQREIARLVARLGVARGGSFGDFTRPVPIIDAEHINHRSVTEFVPTLDGLTAALGSFTFHIGVRGNVVEEPGAGSAPSRYRVDIAQVGIYVRDSFDFEGDQPLGCWNVHTNEVARYFCGGRDIANRHFREFRTANGIGGDFLVFSDVSLETPSPAASFHL